MISKLITYFKNGLVTERELNKLALIAILEEQLIDNNKYTSDLCPKYAEEVLPDENGNCSLCGLHGVN